MSAPRWWSALLERRHAKHQDPFTAEEMAIFRCRVQRLIRAAKS